MTMSEMSVRVRYNPKLRGIRPEVEAIAYRSLIRQVEWQEYEIVGPVRIAHGYDDEAFVIAAAEVQKRRGS